jgi:hypothetical protein
MHRLLLFNKSKYYPASQSLTVPYLDDSVDTFYTPTVAESGGLTDLTFIGHAYARGTTNVANVTFDSYSNTILSGDLIVFCGFWDGSSYTSGDCTGTVGGSSATKIVDNEDGAEYPEGASFYHVATSDSPTIYISTDGAADTMAGALMHFRPNAGGSITTVTVANTHVEDGLNALTANVAASSPTTVPSNEIRIKGYFLTGRPQTILIQNPVPTFTQGGWVHVDGDGNRGGTIDDMDYAYKILLSSNTDVLEDVSTTDTGRQAHHLFSLTIT